MSNYGLMMASWSWGGGWLDAGFGDLGADPPVAAVTTTLGAHSHHPLLTWLVCGITIPASTPLCRAVHDGASSIPNGVLRGARASVAVDFDAVVASQCAHGVAGSIRGFIRVGQGNDCHAGEDDNE